MATELLPVVFVPQMLFAGFFTSADAIPAWLRWVQYFCPLMYTTRLVILAEFRTCEGGVMALSFCNRLVESTGAVEGDEWLYWLMLHVLFFVFRVGGLIILEKKSSL